MNNIRDRSPIRRIQSTSNSVNTIEIMAINFTELNLAKEIVPTYEGGNTNLSYYIQQCEKFINTYRNTTAGQENCSVNKLIFELCCTKLTGAARDTIIISNCTTWKNVKETLLNRFGDQRNETLLENDLITCYQFSNESYEQYYEKIKSKLQQILEHINLREGNDNIKEFKTNLFNMRAQNTFCAGLLEPYRSFISSKTATSLEDALTHLRNYDNHQQQINFLNFIRQKNSNKNPKFVNQPIRNMTRPATPQHFTPFSNYQRPIYTPPSYYQRPIQNPQFVRNSNQFPREPIHIESRPIQQKFPTNSQVFGKKPEYKPTPMSITTRNTNQSNQNQNQNYFRRTNPGNFISKELHNLEQLENYEHDTDFYDNNYDTYDQSLENSYDQSLFENQEENHCESQNENFQTPASTEPIST